jgi:hypothetical protein
MSSPTIRPAYSKWPDYNQRFRDIVASLTDEQLALKPSPERWPVWATIGHAACQRVFWLCDFAGEAGADTTRFTNAGYDCPGDDDLENVLDLSADVRFWLAQYERMIATQAPVYGRTVGTQGPLELFRSDWAMFPLSSDGRRVDQSLEIEDWAKGSPMARFDDRGINWRAVAFD